MLQNSKVFQKDKSFSTLEQKFLLFFSDKKKVCQEKKRENLINNNINVIGHVSYIHLACDLFMFKIHLERDIINLFLIHSIVLIFHLNLSTWETKIKPF